jgi:hypothetical protein
LLAFGGRLHHPLSIFFCLTAADYRDDEDD